MEIQALSQNIQEVKDGFNRMNNELTEMRGHVDQLRRRSLTQSPAIVRPGQVSDGCARHMAGLAIAAAFAQGKLVGSGPATRDRLEGVAKDILTEPVFKTALTTSDIPLPEDWGREVSELVGQYGAARRMGTVYPLGMGTVKLPRLKTSPAFSLLAIATAVTEKSPQIEFVTFTPSKWGGLVRLPNEIDADSMIPLGQFIARYAAREMAKLEDTVFFAADGSGTYDSLKGLTTIVNASNNNKVLTMGTGKTKPSDVTLTNLRNLRYIVDAEALRRGRYAFHPSWEQHFCGFNSDGDMPYQARGAGAGATLDGLPIEWVDTLPVYSTSASASTVIGLFGDFSYQYLGIRSGMALQTSDIAGFGTDEILIRAIERFTIGNMAAGAIAGVVTAAS